MGRIVLTITQGDEYRVKDIIDRFIQVGHRDPTNSVALALQVRGLADIGLLFMPSSIKLDHKSSRQTREVGEVGPDGKLPAEFEARQLSAS